MRENNIVTTRYQKFSLFAQLTNRYLIRNLRIIQILTPQ